MRGNAWPTIRALPTGGGRTFAPMRPVRTPRFLAAFLGLLLLTVVLPKALFHHCEHGFASEEQHDRAGVQADTRCDLCEMVVSAYEGRSAAAVNVPVVRAADRTEALVAALRLGHADRPAARGPPVQA